MPHSFRTLRWLETLFADPAEALKQRLERPPGRAMRDFREDHLLFFIYYALLLPVSPYLWYRTLGDHQMPSIRGLVLPPLLALCFLIFVSFYDRFIENRFSPALSRSHELDPQLHNRALFLSIPVPASLIFFIIHPLPGYLMLLLAMGYSIVQIIHFQAEQEQSSLRRAAAMLIAFGGVMLLPVVVLLLVYNLMLTTRILLDLF